MHAALVGIFDAEHIDAGDIDTAAFMLWSSMHDIAMLAIDDQYGPRVARQISPRERCRQLAELLAAG